MPYIYVAADGKLAFTCHQLAPTRVKPSKGKQIAKDHAVFGLIYQCSTVMFTKQAFIILFKYVFTGELTIVQLFEQMRHLSDDCVQKLALILYYYTYFFYDRATADNQTVQLIAKHCAGALVRPAREIPVYEMGFVYFPHTVPFDYKESGNRFSAYLTPELAAFFLTYQVSYYIKQFDVYQFGAVWEQRKKSYRAFLLRVRDFVAKWNVAKEPSKALLFVLDLAKALRQLNNFPVLCAVLAAVYEASDDAAFYDYQDIIFQDQETVKLTVEKISVEIACNQGVPARYQQYIPDIYTSIGMDVGKTAQNPTYLFNRLQNGAKYCIQQVLNDKKSRLAYLTSMMKSCMPVFYDLDVFELATAGTDEEVAICNYLIDQMRARPINYVVDDNIGPRLFRMFD